MRDLIRARPKNPVLTPGWGSGGLGTLQGGIICTVMPHSRLLHCLNELEPTPAACFVLLYTYFEEVGIVEAENILREDGTHPLKLKPESPYPGEAVRQLAQKRESPAFDLFALSWLKGLDAQLGQERPIPLDSDVVFRGIDGRGYQLGWRNVVFTESPTWEADQSGSLAAYARHLIPVPVEPVEGRRIRCFSDKDWGDRFLHARLARIREKGKLCVLLWPFCGRVDYEIEEVPDPEMTWIRVCGIHNQAEVDEQMESALNAAQKHEATILVFPELILTESGEERLRSMLRRNGREGFPLLTLAGRCHRRGAERNDVNEAILLGPDGTELHRQRKLAAFTDRHRGLAERIEVGKELAVLESRIGNLVPLICLDLVSGKICGLVERSHGNVLLVPSLSDTTRDHRRAAKRLVVGNLAATFVCNRPFHDPQPSAERPAGTSFYRVPRPRPPRELLHFPDQADRPYLLFPG